MISSLIKEESVLLIHSKEEKFILKLQRGKKCQKLPLLPAFL
jgi:hypothetical protein